MKRIALLTLLLGISVAGFSQKYSTKTGKITFFSSTKMEDISAENNQVSGILDAKTGDLAFVVLIKSFEFEKALMQQHFNENYLHSDEFPKSTFVGKITNLPAVDFAKDGTYNVTVSGKLTIHGVSKDVTEKGQIIVSKGKLTLSSKFDILLQDYGIKNDKLNNISNTIQISVATELTKQS